MPWSEWIQSPNEDKLPAARRHLDYGEGDSFTTATDLATNTVDIAGAQANTTTPARASQGTQYKVRDNWDLNAPRPPELGSLTFGVDYDIKPGADPSDPYRYVDYDPTDHAEVLGWTLYPPVVYDRFSAFNISATLWIDPATNYDAGFTAPLNIGTTFDTIDFTTPAGTVLATPPDPGPTLSFTVGISPDVLLEDSGAVNVTMSGSLFENWPVVTVRPQRWRYWRPGILPLRQYPRNDGLKGGAPSARPTSRQATTARRTYL